MALVAGGLALSLVVTTPSNAQAFVPPIPPPVIFGATELVLPELVAVSAVLGPVGWTILGATALGVGLYATQDYWLPYVTGAFGAASPNEGVIAPSLQGATIQPQFDMEPAFTLQDLNGIKVRATYTGPSFPSGLVVSMSARLYCKDQLGVNYEKLVQLNGSVGNGSGAYPRTMNASGYCTATNHTFRGAVIGAFGSDSRLEARGASGSPSRPGPISVIERGSAITVSTAFDPRTAGTGYTATVECIRADGSKFSLTATSTGIDGAVKLPACAVADAGAHGTGKTKVEALAPGKTVKETVWDVQAPAPASDKPLCSSSRPGAGCKLGLKIDNLPCVVGNWDCANWSDLKNDPAQSPRLSCQYGPYSVPLNTCNPLERAYEQGGAPATEPNVDGTPATRSDTDPNGSIIPKTGTGTGTATIPGVGGTPAGVPGATATEGECWPSGWGMLNPLEWVYKPIVCASKQLFEPKKDLQTRLNGMSAAFSDKVPVSWFGVGVQGVSGGACPTNWAVTVHGHSYSLICGTAADGIIQGFRPVLGAMLIMAALWPLVRSLFYAAIPVFKVTPS